MRSLAVPAVVEVEAVRGGVTAGGRSQLPPEPGSLMPKRMQQAGEDEGAVPVGRSVVAEIVQHKAGLGSEHGLQADRYQRALSLAGIGGVAVAGVEPAFRVGRRNSGLRPRIGKFRDHALPAPAPDALEAGAVVHENGRCPKGRACSFEQGQDRCRPVEATSRARAAALTSVVSIGSPRSTVIRLRVSGSWVPR